MDKLLNAVKYLFTNPNRFLLGIFINVAHFLPDKLYLKILFRLSMGYKLNLDNPKTFNEKLQWLKLYNRKPEYTTMVDKYAVKEYVAGIIGEEYIIPTLGVWDKFEEIDFDKLPNRFVLKTTHGGGNTGVVICKDKATFDIEAAKKKLNRSLRSDIYTNFREWPYKNVKRRIIAEVYMTEEKTPDNPNGDLLDYKFFCFNGEVKVMLIATERQTGVKFDYFDKDFNHLPFEQGGPNSTKKLEKPQCTDEMWSIARKLAQGIPHVRVDLYYIDGKIYFGELTFFDSSGMAKFSPKEWDYTFGSWIKLPQ